MNRPSGATAVRVPRGPYGYIPPGEEDGYRFSGNKPGIHLDRYVAGKAPARYKALLPKEGRNFRRRSLADSIDEKKRNLSFQNGTIRIYAAVFLRSPIPGRSLFFSLAVFIIRLGSRGRKTWQGNFFSGQSHTDAMSSKGVTRPRL
jgi:hypothetical protein